MKSRISMFSKSDLSERNECLGTFSSKLNSNLIHEKQDHGMKKQYEMVQEQKSSHYLKNSIFHPQEAPRNKHFRFESKKQTSFPITDMIQFLSSYLKQDLEYELERFDSPLSKWKQEDLDIYSYCISQEFLNELFSDINLVQWNTNQAQLFAQYIRQSIVEVIQKIGSKEIELQQKMKSNLFQTSIPYHEKVFQELMKECPYLISVPSRKEFYVMKLKQSMKIKMDNWKELNQTNSEHFQNTISFAKNAAPNLLSKKDEMIREKDIQWTNTIPSSSQFHFSNSTSDPKEFNHKPISQFISPHQYFLLKSLQ